MVVQALVNRFGVWDYLVFAAMLAVSACIGLYYACAGGGQKTTKDFLMGGRNMGVLPVSLSLLASFLSAITLLGTPVEVYTYGTQYLLIFLGYCVVIPITAYLYMPVFYGLGLTSAYEYLERRFNSVIRKCGSAVYIFQMVFYLSVVTYAPALALNQVTGLHVWGSVAAISAVCTFYTTVGGMKAVMWTDAFQLVIMFGSMLAVIVKGSLDVGGFDYIWQKSLEGDRIEFLNFDPNPLVRHTFWTLGIGGAFTWLSTYAGNQAQIQRYLTCPSLKGAQLALWWNLFGLTALMSICCFGGLVLYTRYWDCDPVKQGLITAPDQMFPLFVMETLGLLTGLPGLFVAGVFSGALSTVSSGLNSLAAVTLEDFVKPLSPNMPDTKATIWSKCLALGYGVLVFGFVKVAENLGNVLQAALSIFGMIGGPILGIFTLGMFFPWANSWGAGAGLFSSLGLVMWIGIGAQVFKPHIPKLSISVDGCSATSSFFNSSVSLVSSALANVTVVDITTTAPVASALVSDDTLPIFKLSYLYYSAVACFVVIFVGMVVSFFTGLTNPEELDPRVICPVFDILCCCCPRPLQRILRCNVGKQYKSSHVDLNHYNESNGGNYVDDEEKLGRDNLAFNGSKTSPQSYSTQL